MNLINNELKYIDRNFCFSPKCTAEVIKYLNDQHLIYKDESGIVFLTEVGELRLGSSKEELRDRYGLSDIHKDRTWLEQSTYEEF